MDDSTRKRKRELPKVGFSCYGHPLEDVRAAGRQIKRLFREYPELDNEALWLEYEKIGGEILAEFLDSVDGAWREKFNPDVDLLVRHIKVKRGRTVLSIGTIKNNRHYSLQAHARYRTDGSEPKLESVTSTDRDEATDAALDVLAKGTMTHDLLKKFFELQERCAEEYKNTIFVQIGC